MSDRPISKRDIEELIAASSLGAPEVVELRRRTPPEVVERIMGLVNQLDTIRNTHGYIELRSRFDGPDDELDAILLGMLRALGRVTGGPGRA